MAETWRTSGEGARQILVAQKLGGLIRQLMSTVSALPIDKVTVIDRALTDGGGNLAVKAAVTSEQLKHTMGVDLAGVLRRMGGDPAAPVAVPPPPPPRRPVE